MADAGGGDPHQHLAAARRRRARTRSTATGRPGSRSTQARISIASAASALGSAREAWVISAVPAHRAALSHTRRLAVKATITAPNWVRTASISVSAEPLGSR